MIRSVFLAVGLGLVAFTVHSFDLNDCIINGMKGISSDTAASQVRFACNQKNKAYKDARIENLMKEFGEEMEVALLEEDKYYAVEEPGFYSIKYTNKSNGKAVTFVRLEVVPAPGGAGTACDFDKRRVHAYRVMLKPGASTKLIYPSSFSANCISPLVVLGRVPTWKDVSFSSSARPASKDPFYGLN